MTDEQVAEVFKSLPFQEQVCHDLNELEKECTVSGVRVVLTHIHFDILVSNGTPSTTTTTTTEMPWGMPWWAWFLICYLSTFLCALCCLPVAGAGSVSAQNPKNSSSRTYHSVSQDGLEEAEHEAA